MHEGCTSIPDHPNSMVKAKDGSSEAFSWYSCRADTSHEANAQYANLLLSEVGLAFTRVDGEKNRKVWGKNRKATYGKRVLLPITRVDGEKNRKATDGKRSADPCSRCCRQVLLGGRLRYSGRVSMMLYWTKACTLSCDCVFFADRVFFAVAL